MSDLGAPVPAAPGDGPLPDAPVPDAPVPDAPSDGPLPDGPVADSAVADAAVPMTPVRTAPMPMTAVPLTAPPLDGPPGAPVLVLGTSLGTSAAVWERQVGQFRERFRLLRFELPGHGGSPSPPGPYTVSGLGRGVLAVLDSLGVERAAYCGISLGGMIGMWLAAHAPERITALGLVCTSAYLPPASSWLARGDQVRAAGMAAVAGPVISRWFTPEYASRAPAVIDAFRAEFERTDPGGYANCCAAIAAMDQRPTLGAITAPTLILAGAADPATPPEHGRVIARGIGGARLEVIPAAAHLAPVSAPERVTAALLAHLRAATAP
jgi:3-oxoadipate enol-lactonase